MYVLLKLSMNQCAGADGAAVARQYKSKSPTRLADLQICANMSRQILNKMIFATLLAPGKVYIYFLSIHFLFVLMTIIPQILDIFDETYPLPPRAA